MQLGMIGLGRMGANMVQRLMSKGHECVVFDTSPKAVAEMTKHGAAGAASLSDLVKRLRQPRVIWLMVPAAVVDRAISDLLPHIDQGDILIDGATRTTLTTFAVRRTSRLARFIMSMWAPAAACGVSNGVTA